jgi:type IV pilus assembly protein PilX
MKTIKQISLKVMKRRLPHQQKGIVLFISLVVLVAMTLAGLAMMRQLGSGVGIAGNLAFRQNATTAADLGVEVAQDWLVKQKAIDLGSNNVSNGYFATWPASFDPVGNYSWDDTNSKLAGTDGNGNTVRFVMHRLCSTLGLPNAPGQQCVTLDSSLSPKAKEGADAATVKILAALTPYFRVTTRTEGPRGTVSYTQVMMF